MKLGRTLWKNPVFIKEIRTRMRGNRAFLLITAHLLTIGLIILLAYGLSSTSGSNLNRMEERRTLGKVLFGLLVGLEMVVISFTAPALTSGAISSEREHQTIDLLKVTLLKPLTLVLGKYISSLVFMFLLLFTAIPLQSPAYLVGGVRYQELILGVLILVISAITFCAVGIFFSSLFRRTLLSTVTTYAFAIFVVFGAPLLGLFFLVFATNSLADLFTSLPVTVKGTLLIIAWVLVSLTPTTTIIATEAYLLNQNNIWLLNIDVPNTSPATQIWLPSPWILFTVFYLLLSLIALVASVLLIRRVSTD